VLEPWPQSILEEPDMVITDAGCAGRFNSLVIDADLRATAAADRERCL
jgi:hypothetical protein